MKESYQKESGQDLSLPNTGAQLLIYTDENGDISFGCDWNENDNGIEDIAKIFFELKHTDLIERIFAMLYKQCVLDDRMDSFSKISAHIHSKILGHKGKNEIVIKPSQLR